MLRFNPEKGRKQIHSMRILQVGPIPPDVGGRTRGGVATHLWDLANHLARQNHQIAVLADNAVTENKGSKIKEGIEIYGRRRPVQALRTCRVFNPQFLRNVGHVKRWSGPLQHLSKIIVQSLDYDRVIYLFKPDVIHVHHLENRFPYAHFLNNGLSPIVTTIHSTHSVEFAQVPLRDLRHQSIDRNLQLAPNLIFVSHFVKKRYEELFPNRLEKLRAWVIHNPVDVSKYPSLPIDKARKHIGRESGQPLILFVGGLIPRKGPKILIESAIRLKAKGINFNLMLVGDGPQRAELKKLIEEKGLSSCVSLEGPKVQSELAYYYHAADLFVLPSFMESFGLVFFEAMLCGCPVLGSPSVLSELLPSREYGYLTSQGDPESLAIAIETALKQSWDREKIRNYALQFDWAIKIKEFEEVYWTVTDPLSSATSRGI
jgi:glycosyltransferase involved in cell wall biosynthesis